MKLSREEVLHIARLARMGITDEEVDKLREQLSDILDNFEVLQQVDTDSVLPTAQSISLNNITRDDAVAPSYIPDDILSNAPRREKDYFKIHAVLEDESP
ncbi:MAG: Asp-tRNA(Asn)/Glu-tRNA(Gln) amidotransferase subunit GatC [Dehalococcoidales bacterium]|nr:MAG: Asp-tRNA(Asn)/Glu-tRNA(Gln) amidotransferase subunit GatC [Dehalococcoidales bacterium]